MDADSLTTGARELTALDASFLELEDADDSALMHIGAVFVFGPGPPPTVEQLRARIDGRLSLVPRFRQRLSTPHVHALSRPSWHDGEHFDIDGHVRQAVLPAPGSEAELLDWAADFLSHRLDRSRPLWELTLVQGMAEDRWALVWKAHHCITDGVGSVEFFRLFLDLDPSELTPSQAAVPPADGSPSRGAPSWLRSLGHAAGSASELGRSTAGALRHPGDSLRRSRAIAGLLVDEQLHAAPKSSLNVEIGSARRFDAVQFPLEEIQAIRGQLGGTLNDVMLCATAGGLRALLLHRGEAPPADGMRAMVPVNLRGAAPTEDLGNRVATMFVDLPVDEEDAVRRLERISAAMGRLKHSGQAAGVASILNAGEIVPPLVHNLLLRSYDSARLFNVTVTNVPGPREPLHAFGAPMLDLIPVVPLAARHAIGIAIASYVDHVTFGLFASRSAVPDLEVLSAGIFATLLELDAAANRSSPTPA